MKISVCTSLLFLWLIIYGCQENKGREVSYLHTLTDSLPINKEKNIIIYSLNPNDCINCLYGFTSVYFQLSQTANPKVFIVPIDREIEKKELQRTTKNISLTDSINKVVIWNKKLFSKLSESTGHSVPVSLLAVYNYKNDSILFCKAIKEIGNIEELKLYFER